MGRAELTIVHSRYGAHKFEYFSALADAFNVRLVTIFDDLDDDLMPSDLEARTGRMSLGLSGVRVRHYNARSLAQCFRLIWRASKGSSGILTSTQNPVHSKVAWVVSRLRRIPLLVVVQQWQDYPDQGLVHGIYDRLSIALMRSADRCFVHGRFSWEFAARVGVAESAIRRFPYLNEDIGGIGGVAVPEADSGLRLLYVGRYVEVKGLHVLLDAFARVLELHPEAQLRLYGDGPLRTELESRAEGMRGSVEVRERVAPAELRDVMSWCHALVLPSVQLPLAYEGWGMVVGEAASVGRALVVSSVVGSGPEYVSEGQNGYVVEQGDIEALFEALMRLADHPERLRDMGARSRRIFEDYSDANVCVQLVAEAIR